MTVLTRELDPIERKEGTLYRSQATATLGDGSRVVWAESLDSQEEATKLAEMKAAKAERVLAAVEVHDENDLEHFRSVADHLGLTAVRSPEGEIAEATAATLPALLAAGWVTIDDPGTEPVGIGPVGKTPRRRKASQEPVDEM